MKSSATEAPPSTRPPVALVLAGGLSSRMGGGDKGLRLLAGVPLLGRITAHVRRWTDIVLLSANDDAGRFHDLPGPGPLTVVADTVPDRPGPLAGILAAMDWTAANRPDRTHILCVPCDTPFLPANLYPALAAALAGGGGTVAMAVGPDGVRHPTVALWPVSLREDLRTALRDEGLRKVGMFAARHGRVDVPFPAGPDGIDPFFNINGPDDLVRAEEFIRSAGP